MNAFHSNALRHREQRLYWMTHARSAVDPVLRQAYVAFARAAQMCFLRQVRLARKFAA
jgi:hypothetical protein